MRNIGNMHAEEVAAVILSAAEYGIVKIPAVLAVNGNQRHIPTIPPPGQLIGADLLRYPRCFLTHSLGESLIQAVLPQHQLDIPAAAIHQFPFLDVVQYFQNSAGESALFIDLLRLQIGKDTHLHDVMALGAVHTVRRDENIRPFVFVRVAVLAVIRPHKAVAVFALHHIAFQYIPRLHIPRLLRPMRLITPAAPTAFCPPFSVRMIGIAALGAPLSAVCRRTFARSFSFHIFVYTS